MQYKLLALATLTAIGALRADVLYNQPSVWSATGGVGTGWTDEETAAGTGFQTFDNFSITTGGSIVQVSWQGLYIQQTQFINELPNTTSWDLNFYANNAGVPGTLLASTNLLEAQLSTVDLGKGTFGGVTFDIYQMTATIPSFAAAAGTTYWFSPFSHNPNESAKFIWIDATGGDSIAHQIRLTAGATTGTFVIPGDRAFELLSAPEPSALWLVGAGCLLIPRLRKRATA